MVFAALIIGGGFAIFGWYSDKTSEEDEFRQCMSDVVHETPANQRKHIDLAKLRRINPDAIGWLYIPDTEIDYPVVQTDNPDYYLHTSIYGKRSSMGTLFILAGNDIENDHNLIIYGHHLKHGGMFSSLIDFKDRAYYERHTTICLDTIYGEGEYEVTAAFEYDARDPIPEPDGDGQFITLSTCDRSFNREHGRFAVQARKRG